LAETPSSPSWQPIETPIVLDEVVLAGEISQGEARFTLTARARVTAKRGGTIEVLSGRTALLEVTPDPRARLRAEGGRYYWSADRAGSYPIQFTFQAGVEETNGWRHLDFQVAAGPMRRLSLRGLAPGTQFTWPGGFRPQAEGEAFAAVVPVDGRVRLAWQEARAESEGRLFFAADSLTQVTVSPGLMRQVALFEFKVLQGEMRQVVIGLRGEGEITRVQGDQVLAWQVTTTTNQGGRELRVDLNQPQKEAFSLQVQAQTPLGAFPQAFGVLQLEPEQGTRTTGHVRIVNDGAVRLEVVQAAGLSQISPDQFPASATFRALQLPAGAQSFVYRFSGGAFELRLQADNILPEVSVSQVTAYHLGESELSIEAELELEVREAPLRELNLELPADYTLARLQASEMTDYFVTVDAAASRSRVRVVYGKPISGRQVLHLRLERNASLGETSWALPRIDVPRAKSVRGYVGVTADAGFRLAPLATEGLTDLATAFFPKKLAGLQAAYRINDARWSARLGVERLAQSIQADALHLFSVAEGIAYGSSVINYLVSGAPLASFKIALSEEYYNVEFTGREIRNWQKVDGGYLVQLHTPVAGAYTLLATYERPFPAHGASLSFAGARPLDAQAEQGHTLVVSVYQFQVQPVNVSSNLMALETGEVPAEYRLFFDAPILAAYRYASRPFALTLELKPLAQEETVSQVVDRAALRTRISQEGQVLTDARYFVKSKGAPHFRVTIPANSQLWSATVNGRATVPVLEGKAHLVPLPAQADANAVQTIELKLATRSSNATRFQLTAPAIGAPVLLSEWQLTPEIGKRLVYTRGNLTPAGSRSDNTGFGALTRMIEGAGKFEQGGRWLAALGLLWVASIIWRQTALAGTLRYGLRFWCALSLGAVACLVAGALLVAVSGEAVRQGATPPADLHFVVPVQQIGEAPTLAFDQIEARSSWFTTALSLWPAAAGIAVWIWTLARVRGRAKVAGWAAGWLLLFWSALRAPGGAPYAVALFGVFVLCQVIVPSLRRLFRLPRQTLLTSPGAATATIALGLALGLIRPVQAGAHDVPAVLADRVDEVAEVQRDQVTSRVDVTWTARKGQVLVLLTEPAVLTSAEVPKDALELIGVQQEGRRGSALRARREGRFSVRFAYQTPVHDRDGEKGVLLGTRPALVRLATVRLADLDVEVVAASATVVRQELARAGQDTVAHLVLAPTDEVWVHWRPRNRDTSREQAVFYVEANHLFVPASGVLEGLHHLQVRPAQGELRELTCAVPPGMTVTDVACANLSFWRFDPDQRVLRLAFNPPLAKPFTAQVRSQRPTPPLPYEQTAGLLSVQDAASQIGLVGVATGSEVQLEDVQASALSPINLEDFPAALVQSLRDQHRALGLRRTFRYGDATGDLTVKAAAVEPDVRVESQQTLSLGEDRMLLAANLAIDITRAGIFRLSFPLPAGMEVESISGPALSHWTELKTAEDRIITMHLTSKTEGQTQMAITLGGPGLKATSRWLAPRLILQSAGKQRGQLTIVPELGMRLQILAREGVTQLDPARAGIRQKGVLAFRLLEADWQIALEVSQVDSWIQVQSLQDVTVTEGQVKVAANLHYSIENTSVKSLRVALPAGADSVRFMGDQMADFLPAGGPANGPTQEWEIKLHRRIFGQYQLQATFQWTTPPTLDEVTIGGVQCLDANLQRGFLTLRSRGRLQLRIEGSPTGLQTAEWQSIPRPLQGELDGGAANYTFRLVEPQFSLPVKLGRHEAARLLPARVSAVTLTSVVSDGGVMLTQARLELTPGDKRLLDLKLPPRAHFWFAFVDQNSVWPWREDDRILIPLEQHSKTRGTAVVEFFYTLPTAAAQGRALTLALAGPKFDLPLENVTWQIYLNGRWTLRDWSGTLQLQEEAQTPPTAGIDVGSYLQNESQLKQQQIQTAEQMLSFANTKLAEGDPEQARKAFRMAYGLSQQDQAFNEDARVQLHNLKMQQALIGLNARQAVVEGDAAAPALRLRGRTNTATLNYTQEEAKELLLRNSAEESAVQMRLAERLIQQQDAAAPSPAAIRASIPEEGRKLVFRRALLVDPWADLHLELRAQAVPIVSASARVGWLAAVLLVISLLLWANRSPREPRAA
jgi:hypothetical protein